jgi:hypothetical protein
MDGGRHWAAASARTLARRLRRECRERLGGTRASALAHRCRLLRCSLAAHWALSDAVGGHSPSLADALAAAAAIHLGGEALAEAKAGLVEGNWARHAPPPGVTRLRPQPEGIRCSSLEEFREQLWPEPRKAGTGMAGGDTEIVDVGEAGARAFLQALDRRRAQDAHGRTLLERAVAEAQEEAQLRRDAHCMGGVDPLLSYGQGEPSRTDVSAEDEDEQALETLLLHLTGPEAVLAKRGEDLMRVVDPVSVPVDLVGDLAVKVDTDWYTMAPTAEAAALARHAADGALVVEEVNAGLAQVYAPTDAAEAQQRWCEAARRICVLSSRMAGLQAAVAQVRALSDRQLVQGEAAVAALTGRETSGFSEDVSSMEGPPVKGNDFEESLKRELAEVEAAAPCRETADGSLQPEQRLMAEWALAAYSHGGDFIPHKDFLSRSWEAARLDGFPLPRSRMHEVLGDLEDMGLLLHEELGVSLKRNKMLTALGRRPAAENGCPAQ